MMKFITEQEERRGGERRKERDGVTTDNDGDGVAGTELDTERDNHEGTNGNDTEVGSSNGDWDTTACEQVSVRGDEDVERKGDRERYEKRRNKAARLWNEHSHANGIGEQRREGIGKDRREKARELALETSAQLHRAVSSEEQRDLDTREKSSLFEQPVYFFHLFLILPNCILERGLTCRKAEGNRPQLSGGTDSLTW